MASTIEAKKVVIATASAALLISATLPCAGSGRCFDLGVL
jgi:hypothetical protein